ncbi:MAG: MBL fold metallo-hydrolase [Planctomycetota bacterium]|nr:MAG: MBL fold metallo-hydrolase [Planctomycetota bacterium]
MIFDSLVVFEPFSVNCYIFGDEATKQALVFDPGGDADAIAGRLEKHGLTPAEIVLTHGHGDHISAGAELVERYGAEIAASETTSEIIQDPQKNLSAAFGMPIRMPAATHVLAEGDTLELGEISFSIISVPGHEPGHLAFFSEKPLPDQTAPFVVLGDMIQMHSVGRTDFPHGDTQALIRSIQEKLYTLPDETVTLSGHGGASTIGYEKEHNMFVRADMSDM